MLKPPRPGHADTFLCEVTLTFDSLAKLESKGLFLVYPTVSLSQSKAVHRGLEITVKANLRPLEACSALLE